MNEYGRLFVDDESEWPLPNRTPDRVLYNVRIPACTSQRLA